MVFVSQENAATRLIELIDRLQLGEEVQITRAGQPIARLIVESSPIRQPRQPGSAVGLLTIISEDDDYLDDFKDHIAGKLLA